MFTTEQPDNEWYSGLRALAESKVLPFTYAQLKALKQIGQEPAGFHRSNRIHLPTLNKWLEVNPDALTAGPVDESFEKWRARKTKADALRSELELARLQNRLVDKADVKQLIQQVHGSAFALLKSKLTQELPPKLLGLDVVKMNVITCQVFEEICRLMQGIETLVEEHKNEPATED